MNEYEFVLKFKLPNPEEDPANYLEALGAAGCDDALVGTGHTGHVVLDFTREAENAKDAVLSAINDVHTAIEGAELFEALPDYVGVTDVADILEITRQAVRKIIVENVTFPSPVHEGVAAIWHLSDIADFFASNSARRSFNTAIRNTARINRALNVNRQIKIISCLQSREDCSSKLLPQEIEAILDETPLLAENNHAS